MSASGAEGGRTRIAVVVVPIVLVLLPILVSLGGSVLGTEAAEPFLAVPVEGVGDCDGRDVAEMRFHHMDLLKRIRDQALRHGVRGDTQIRDCLRCHADREKFCDRCHDAVDLHPDCWGCHDPTTAHEEEGGGR
jgi:[DsrC]-trisulfide reductase subunit J